MPTRNIKIKKSYKVGDSAWIYGIEAGFGYNRLTEGRVVHEMEIEGYPDTHYVIAISNSVQDLLEVRTWEEISQDSSGPTGSFREILMNDHATQKKLLRTGMRLPKVELNPDYLDDASTESDQD
jgi:hypothetical protein